MMLSLQNGAGDVLVPSWRPESVARDNKYIALILQGIQRYITKQVSKNSFYSKGNNRAYSFYALLTSDKFNHYQKFLFIYILLTESNGRDLKKIILNILESKGCLRNDFISKVAAEVLPYLYLPKACLEKLKSKLLNQIHVEGGTTREIEEADSCYIVHFSLSNSVIVPREIQKNVLSIYEMFTQSIISAYPESFMALADSVIQKSPSVVNLSVDSSDSVESSSTASNSSALCPLISDEGHAKSLLIALLKDYTWCDSFFSLFRRIAHPNRHYYNVVQGFITDVSPNGDGSNASLQDSFDDLMGCLPSEPINPNGSLAKRLSFWFHSLDTELRMPVEHHFSQIFSSQSSPIPPLQG